MLQSRRGSEGGEEGAAWAACRSGENIPNHMTQRAQHRQELSPRDETGPGWPACIDWR